jgi:DNA modification methylase
MNDCTLINGDCLEAMSLIPDGSIDAVICDPPYGTTACKWDSVIPFEPMWKQLKRITKPNGAIVLTASQPFTSALIMSNARIFKYCWVWDKVNRPTGHLNAKKRPMRQTEDVIVFCLGKVPYNPQMTQGKPYRATGSKNSDNYGTQVKSTTVCDDGLRYPRELISIKADERGTVGRIHPTQKPVALMEYLIRTYTNQGETVLDFTMGSGTTGVACKNLGRSFIGIEMDADYFALASKRIADTPEIANE